MFAFAIKRGVFMSKICCFAGHRNIGHTDEIYIDLIKIIEGLIKEENVTDFWVGNYGDFDSLSGRAVRELKERYPDIRLNLIIPYLTYGINEYNYLYQERYDKILIADVPENTPEKLKILKCNKYMVDKSDFIISYVKYEWGGAYKTLEYAKRTKNIKIFNLANK